MNPIGIIDLGRLRHIPKRRRPHHEFCFHLHDTMTALLVEMERSRVHFVKFNLSSKEEIKKIENADNIFDFLEASGRREVARQAAFNRINVALFADTLHFIYESLIALEKRKFTVSLSLMRKPFKEALILLTWMMRK